MDAVLLTIYTLIVLALIGVVLLQRSDGGALGIGGGGGGFMTGRGAANALTRTTSVLAFLFFAMSLLLAIRAGGGEDADSIADQLTGAGQEAPAAVEPGEYTTDELLNSLSADEETPAPANDAAPAAGSEPETVESLIEDLGGEAPAAAPEAEADAAPQDGSDAAEEEAPQQ